MVATRPATRSTTRPRSKQGRHRRRDGSGRRVLQAAKVVLTDDNFATLVHAVDVGRDIYRRISTYVRLQLTVLSAILQLMVPPPLLDINGGIALFPMQLALLQVLVIIMIVVGIIVDVGDPDVMRRPPRPPGTRIVNRGRTVRWVVTGLVIAASALAVLSGARAIRAPPRRRCR